MFSFLKSFKRPKIWDFKGGIHPPEMKTQSNGTPLRELPLPEHFFIPLKQHIGDEGDLCVKPGDTVLRGQPLTRGFGRMLPIHAPTSGKIVAIAPHITAHPSALPEMCVQLTADGQDRWIEKDPWPDYWLHSHEALIERISQFGVAGLGGAGFPTGVKLRGGGNQIDTLIINAAECEPYITADDRLMQDYASEIITGTQILAHILKPTITLIGIEDNKPAAIKMLKAALKDIPDIALRVVPTKYPSGGAKQLTQILTGKQVPHGGRSSDIGVLMQNVGTAFAVKRAIIDGEPLTERVVTLTGEAIKHPANVWARFGTPIRHLLLAGGYQADANPNVIMGGPLMGFKLASLDVPVVKITNCLLAPSTEEIAPAKPEQGCIRCSACADACPADLLPQQLFWFSQGKEHDKAQAYNLADCIECGACAWVCPSNIPLIQYFRQEKAEIREIALEHKRTAVAKSRFEARQARLERDKAARQLRHQQAAVKPNAQQADAIQAALAREQNRRNEQASAAQSQPMGDAMPNAALAEARAARKAQARAHQAAKRQDAVVIPTEDTEHASPGASIDPRQAAVQAAIARAKARKAAAEPETTAATPAPETDPRKAAVEAAIARAKARKAAAEPETTAATPAPETDPRKAAVEAAIARAKARKAAAEPETTAATPAPETDPRKAAVEAAIARAKARKAAAEPETTAATPAPETDPRKAAVEAAIARAKARKAAAEPETTAATPAPETDPRKAAVEAAIARAKARKAAAEPETTAAAPAPETDPRKAAVEAAIARAKARKAAAEPETTAAAPAPETDPRKAAVEAAIARAKARKAAAEPETTAAAPAPETDPRKAAVEAAIARAKARKMAHQHSEE